MRKDECKLFSVAFRLDFGKNQGLGHLTRCRLLADYMIKQGVKVLFVCKFIQPEAIDWLKKYKFVELSKNRDHSLSEWSQKLDAELTHEAILKAGGAEWIFLDNYELDFIWESHFKELGYKVAVIEDYRTRYHNADVIISESPQKFKSSFLKSAHYPLLLTGPKYAMVKRKHTNNPVQNSKSLRRIVVTYGASDPSDETIKVMTGLKKCMLSTRDLTKLDVHVVKGPLNESDSEIYGLSEIFGFTVEDSLKGLSNFFSETDIVLTAGGNTMVEALSAGAVCIVTLTDENQRCLSEHLSDSKLIFLMGSSIEVDENSIKKCLSEVISNYNFYRNNINRYNPFDGHGVERIYKEIILKF